MFNSNYIIRVISFLCTLFISTAAFGQSWSSLGTGTNNDIYAMVVYNNSLVVSGTFTTAGGSTANRVAVWNGTSWSTLGTGFNNKVYSLCVYNGNLIAGGTFTTAGGVSANRIAVWNGSAWSQIGTGIDNGQVNALAVYSGNLVAGGTFTTVNSITMDRIAKWNGTSWSVLANGLGSEVDALTLFNGNLIVGGKFTTAGIPNTPRIVMWNGSAWSAMGVGIDDGQVYALQVYNSNLIVGGSFSKIGGTTRNSIAVWNGTAWSGLSTGVNSDVYALNIYSGDLYAGGNFSTAGGSSASMIAKWNGSAWSALGSGITGTGQAQVNAISDYDGLMTAAGNFNTAGGLSANNVARWGSAPAVPTLVSPANSSTNQSLTLTLDWSDVTNASSYGVQVSTTSTFTTTVVNTSGLAVSQYTVPGGILSNNTTYYWRANASNGQGSSSYSAYWQFSTSALGVPSLVSPLNGALNQSLTLLLDWSDVASATSYRVQVSTDSLFSSFAFDSSGTTVSQLNVPNGKLSNSIQYYWRAAGVNAGGQGGWSSVWHFRTIIASPVLLLPANGAVNQSLTPLLDWSDVTSATSYRIQISTDSLFGSFIIDTSGISISQLTVPGGKLSTSILYYWRAAAINAGGQGGWSAIWRFRTIIASPVLLLPVNGAVNQSLTPLLDWSDVASATSYRVQVSTDSLFSSLAFDSSGITVSQLNVPNGKLSNSIQYYWRAAGVNAGGQGGWSSAWHFRTIIASPVLLLPVNGAVNQSLTPLLDWSDVTSATGYRLQLSADSTFGSISLDSSGISVSQIIIPSGLLANSIKYYWRVDAANGYGTGGWSAVWHFSTLSPAPPPPFLVSPSNHAVGQNLSLPLQWNQASGAVSYRVQLAIDSLFGNIVVDDSTVTDTVRSVSGLNPLTYYWWRVSAKGSGQLFSSFSGAYNFRTIGAPLPVTPVYPPNNSINQPTALTFQWTNAIEQLSRNGTGGRNKFGLESINNYWFELVSDTITLANLIRDTTLTDTIKTINGLNYQTHYFWRVKARNQAGWGDFSVWSNMTTIPLPPALVNLKVIPGAYYNLSTGQLNMTDTLLIVLVDSATCTPKDSARVVVDSVSFGVNLSFPQVQTGSYYIYVFQRNHLAISSAYTLPVTRGSLLNYDFTTDSAKTFGFNVMKVSDSPVIWGMIPGDANQDGYVDGIDQIIWINENGQFGFFASDFNGDSYVDGLDQILWILYNGNSTYLPCYFSRVLAPHNNPVMKMKNTENSNIWRNVMQQNRVKQNNLKK